MLQKKNNSKKYLFFTLLSLLLVSLVANFYFIFSRNKFTFNRLKKTKSVKVIRVLDGDTFDTSDGERFRIYQIDAPEYPKGCLGIDAKIRLEKLILNKTVKIEEVKKDNFGRLLSYVYLNDLLVNEVMLEEGLAYFITAKPMDSRSFELEKAQTKAKKAERSVWSSLCQTQKEGCLIKGNYRSADTTRIYHTPDCYNYDRISIRDGTSDRWFCTEEEAISAGFRKSLDCPK